ncbi:hypothetical protein HPB47_026865 [Ixodes persulcatus]|uniref:Uncharacterized protein n=1 Tax=Ixodes persulcatus TaxID=34615 RepID=A0AC60PXX0_IXOPE|nr:hypothetical protein HPB47_026865 [Ixodes persulcatus]
MKTSLPIGRRNDWNAPSFMNWLKLCWCAQQLNGVFFELDKVSDYKVFVNPHRTLNYCQGVVFEDDLLESSDQEILEGLSGEEVTARGLCEFSDSVAPPKLPRVKTTFHRLGPKPRVVLDTTPSQSSEGSPSSTSQRSGEAMQVYFDPTEPSPNARGEKKNHP